jgi:hypothetical protein
LTTGNVSREIPAWSRKSKEKERLRIDSGYVFGRAALRGGFLYVASQIALPVVAELRFCADENPPARNRRCRMKNSPKPFSLLTITVFLVRMFFIRTKNTVGARERAKPVS